MTEPICNVDDYTRLLQAILDQAMEDYIKLMPRKMRNKQHLESAFLTAVDMLFDETYLMLHVKDQEGKPMSLKALVAELLDDDRIDMRKLQEYTISKALEFWETKFIDTLYIPDTLVIEGHVYTVLPISSGDEPSVDYQTKIIRIDKDDSNSDNQEAFVKIAFEILCYHQEVPISQANVRALGSGLFRLLRMNSCFTG